MSTSVIQRSWCGAIVLMVALAAGCKKDPSPEATPESSTSAPPEAPKVEADAVTAAAPPGPPLQIKVAPPQVGLTAEITEVNKMSGTITAGGQSVPMIQHDEEKRVEQVLAVDGPVVTRLKVSYLASLTHEKMGDEEKKGDGPRKGKTYIVAFDKGQVVVLDAKGKPLKGDDAKALAEEYEDKVGRVSPMSKILETKTFRPGEPVALTPEEMTALVPDDGGSKGEAMSLTLLERQGDHAIMAFDGAMVGKQGGMEMRLTIKGTAKVDVTTGRSLEMNVAGDMKGSGTGDFTGTLSSTVVTVYKQEAL